MTTSSGIRQPGTEATIVLRKYLEYDNAYCGVFRVRRGRIAEVREYLDSLHAAQVLFGDAPSQGPARTAPRTTDPEDEHGAATPRRKR